MQRRIKNILNFLLRLGLSALLIIFLFRKIDLKQVFSLIKSADPHYFALAAVTFLLCNLLLLLRWNIIIKGLDVHISFPRIAISFFIGLFFNIFLPSSTGGDIARSIDLSGHTPHKARIITSVVLDRLSGFVSIVLICAVSLILGYKYVNDNSLFLILAAFLFLLVLIIMVLFSKRVFSWVSRIFSHLPAVSHKLLSLNDAFIMFRNKYGVIVASTLLSIVSQLIFFLCSYYIVRSFHLNVGMIYFLILIPIITMITTLPISIGGLGVRDASSVYFFAKIGVDSSTALGLSLTNFVFLTAIGLVGGIVYVLTVYPRRLQYRQANSRVLP